jgi:predicted phage terminase large subunit-like protein
MTMAPSPGKIYADLLRNDFCAFMHRSFLELNPQARFEPNWHLDVLGAALEDVRLGACKRLIITLPPRHLKSHAVSIAFAAWLLGHEPAKQILAISYGQDLSDKLARDCRALIMSPFYQALFGTRLSEGRSAIAEFETTDGGYRLSTSVGGVVTGRGADVIIVDDPMKAEDALSDARRQGVNDWYDNTLRSRLNRQDEGAIIIVMQRLHANDLVAHLQETENWDVLSLPAIAEQDERYTLMTPYGQRIIQRRAGEILHPKLLPASELENLRRSMTEYNFAAQYQQDPQPPSGLIVRRKWLKSYSEEDKPERFAQIVQSWDTASKVTDLSSYSVCTTWGVKRQHMYLLDVFRRRMEFPELKRMVGELARLWRASIVLVEDKSSGTQLIQELRADGFSRVQAAPANNDDKVMRLRAQTAKIEGGFALFPEKAPWLDAYLLELTTFPNSKYDDQVDSTVHALAWLTEEATKPGMGAYRYMQAKHEQLMQELEGKSTMKRVHVPQRTGYYTLISGRRVVIPPDGIIKVTEEELEAVLQNGGKSVD